MGVRVVGTGKYVPDMVVSNTHLHAKLGFDSDWIVKRTGILERRHAAPHQATSDLCVEAAADLFIKTGRTAKDCDLLVQARSPRTCRSRPPRASCRTGWD